jgi:small subunit ribosomal protein S17
MSKKLLQGIVVSDKMQKTVVVQVESIKEHPKYKRRYKSHKKYKAHDQNQEYHIGDKVVIEETTPVSKDKKWKVVNKIQK